MSLAATTTHQYSKNTQTTQLLLTHWREMSRNASNFTLRCFSHLLCLACF